MDGTVPVQSDNQKIAERSCRLQIPHMPNVQQIKTSVRGYNLLPGQPQLFAAIGKLLKLDDFWTHSFSLILRLCVNRSWPLTNLRDGLPKWRKEKQNAMREDRGPVTVLKSARIPRCISPVTDFCLMLIALASRTRMDSHFCSPSHVMPAQFSPVGTLIGEPSSKRECPRI